jgi:hypothetical protein
MNSIIHKRISGVTTTFANLEIKDTSVTLKIFNTKNSIDINYIEKVYISKSGYIIFYSGSNSFAFSHPDMRNNVKEIELTGVTVDRTNLKIAYRFVYAQLVFVLIFFVFFIITFFFTY